MYFSANFSGAHHVELSAMILLTSSWNLCSLVGTTCVLRNFIIFEAVQPSSPIVCHSGRSVLLPGSVLLEVHRLACLLQLLEWA